MSVSPQPENRDPTPARAKFYWLAVASLILLWALAVTPLVDRYFLHNYEADSSTVLFYTAALRDVLLHPATTKLPPLEVYPPYFDGQFWVYGLCTQAVAVAQSHGLLPAAFLPTDESRMIFAIRTLHAGCHLASALCIFATALLVTRRTFLAWAAAAFFLFSHQVLSIDFLRIDHLILALFCLSILLAVKAGQTKHPLAVAIALAATAGLLICTKVTSLVLLIPVVFLFASNLPAPERRARTWIIISSVAGVVAALFQIRYLLHLPEIPGNLTAKYADVKQWEKVMSRHPLGYYIVDLFRPNGWPFLLTALSGCATAAVLSFRRSTATPFGRFLALSFVLFGALSVFAFKYSRGGYHLVPIYALSSAYLLAQIERFSRRWLTGKTALYSGSAAVGLLALAFAIGTKAGYLALRQQAAALASSTRKIRVEPLEWLTAHFPKNARLLIPIDSGWAMPVFEEAGFKPRITFLDFPYLDRAKMGQFHPPDRAQLAREADLVVLNDFHPQSFLNIMEKFGHRQNAAEWRAFYNELLPTFPSYRFVSAEPNYGVREIRIVVINPSIAINPLPAPEPRFPNLVQ